jgi:putative hydrolase of the HAD superfamily
MRTLLIDADDTLWENNVHYMHCSENLSAWLVGLGVARPSIASTIAHYEQQLLPTFGYSPHGFIEALALATRQLAIAYQIEVTPDLIEKARSFGTPMLHPPMVLFPRVRETLAVLARHSRLVLVTKGDQVLQKKKLERSGLAAFFNQVYVLVEKDADGYLELVRRENLEPIDTWMIGNSPKSDINPAIEAGLHAIFIPYDNTWSAECVDIIQSARVITLPHFFDLLDYFKPQHPEVSSLVN